MGCALKRASVQERAIRGPQVLGQPRAIQPPQAQVLGGDPIVLQRDVVLGAAPDEERVALSAVAILLAAGSGERLGSKLPKAFVPVSGRPMLEWSLRAIAACPDIDLAYHTVRGFKNTDEGKPALRAPSLSPGALERVDE